MAKLKNNPKLTTTITLELSEEEARALIDIAGYGTDEFIKFFYSNMGEHYLKQHEDGLRSLFEAIRELLVPILDKFDNDRRLIGL